MLMSVGLTCNVATAADAPLLVSREQRFDFTSEPYRDLLARSSVTAFQTAAWLAPLHAGLAPGVDAEAATIVVADAVTGRLVLVLPLIRRLRHGLAVVEMADFGVTDYHAPVVDTAELPRLLADASLPHRIDQALAPYDVLRISKTSGHEALLGHLLPRAWSGVMRISSHGAAMAGSWQDWRAANIASRVRRYLDKKRRSFSRQGAVDFRLATDAPAITAAFAALRRFRRFRFASIGAEDVMAEDAVYDFYCHVARAGAASGEARTYVLSLDGTPVAVVFGIVHRNAFLHLLLGYDIETHGRRSLGLLASEDALRATLESGIGFYDFTVGDYPFKAQLGASARTLTEWHQAGSLRGWLAVTWLVVVREAKRRLKPILRPEEHPPYSPLAGDQK